MRRLPRTMTDSLNLFNAFSSMKSFHCLLFQSLALAAVVALGAGCSKSGEAAEKDPHAGHAHAATSASEAGADADHDHGTNAAGVKMCPEHNMPLSECGICKPEKLAGLKPGEGLKVRLADAHSAEIAGVKTVPVETGTLADGVECYAEIQFNQNKLAHIAAPVSGIIQEVAVDLGGQVTENQVVAKIWSASIAEAVARAYLSHQTLERERKLRADRVTPERDLQQAEADHRAACQHLRTLGFSEEQVDLLGARPQESIMLEVRAPFAGEIVDRTAVRGALIEAGKPLFMVADRSTMWAMLNLPETELARVRTGQAVELRIESLPGRVFTGKLTWVGAEVDEKTRMARARAEVADPEGLLKAKMFAQARIVTQVSDKALLLPRPAIQKIEGLPMVFVKLGDDLFEARAVSLGARHNESQSILAGLKPGEIVAVEHVFPLKSALLISHLGAGCADD